MFTPFRLVGVCEASHLGLLLVDQIGVVHSVRSPHGHRAVRLLHLRGAVHPALLSQLELSRKLLTMLLGPSNDSSLPLLSFKSYLERAGGRHP
uniref:Secreted protein n=1 Tax=Steinernema glaseri TaxID=37863 RepID=A0A1I7ZTE8_9BILA